MELKFVTKRIRNLTEQELEQCSNLFSLNYGKYSGEDKRFPKGKRIVMSVAMYKKLYTSNENVYISMCYKNSLLLGQAIFLHKDIPGKGKCSWVLQLVVDSKYRGNKIGTNLLQSAWGFSDYFACGLATANAITLKTLESVTWRKISIDDIIKNISTLEILMDDVPFVDKKALLLSPKQSQIFSNFYPEIEKSNFYDDLKVYTTKLGKIEPGYEWLAFTFSSQSMYYSKDKFQSFLEFSEHQLKEAYSRMDMPVQKWAKGTRAEIDFILSRVPMTESSRILDLGCGHGRHCIELTKRGFTNVTGIDFSESNISKARESALKENSLANFVSADARKICLGVKSDVILCLYDVIGSFRNEEDNTRIIRHIKRNLKKGAYAIVSVMNMELTQVIATNVSSISANPQALLSLPPSRTMEESGNIFNPKYYLINTDDNLVYRKEQFISNDDVFAEYVVADKRYRMDEIIELFNNEGFSIIDSRYVQAGHWDIPLQSTDSKAKEILLIVQNN